MERRYWREAAAVPSTLPLLPEILSRLRPDDRILDLGCGAGRMLADLAGRGLGRLRLGLDINPPSLAAARDKGLDVVRADLTALPLADACCDACLLSAVMTCLVPASRRLAVLREARRVTRRVLCLADFLRNWDLPLYRARYEAGRAETGEPGSFLVRDGQGEVLYAAHHFTLEELRELLRASGFAVEYVTTPRVRTRSGNEVRGVVLTARAV